ncbi:LOW QUALITY PROTEIN: nucleosome assembly protein 1-like 3, partial [Erethizon dorsatum]
VAEKDMPSWASDSGEDSDHSSSSSCTSCSSSSPSSSRKKRVPEPSRRVRRAPPGTNFVDRLPQAIRNSGQALRNIQDECDKVDALFVKAIHDLKRYAEPNKRICMMFQIINAEYEPSEQDCEWNSEDEEFSSNEGVQMPLLEGEEKENRKKSEVKAEVKAVLKESPEVNDEEKKQSLQIVRELPKEKDTKEVPQAKAENKGEPKESKPRAPVETHNRVPETRPKERVNLKRSQKGEPKREDPVGIPVYWLTVSNNADKLGQKYDEPILKFLSLSLKFSKPDQPISYTVEFHFLSSPYFRKGLVMKRYIMRSKPDHNPFYSWGEIEDCKCGIDWRRGKDVTVTTTHSHTTAFGETETNTPFFNFFSPPEIPKIGKLELWEDAILNEDFQSGQILHDDGILKSIYYYTEVSSTYYQDGIDYGNREYHK